MCVYTYTHAYTYFCFTFLKDNFFLLSSEEKLAQEMQLIGLTWGWDGGACKVTGKPENTNLTPLQKKEL